MKSSEFVKKIKSRYVWGNLLAMFGVVVLLCVGIKFGLDIYTHHGEEIEVPNIMHKSFADAQAIMDDAGLEIVVSDTGYVRSLPPDCILEQSPEPGSKVKSGHIIYVTVNSAHTPTLTIPDVIDNSSLREAMAKLTAMGFKLAQPQYISGEKDWVYGITCRGRHVVAGDRVAIDDPLVILVGNGKVDEADSIDVTDPDYQYDQEGEGDVDEFEEVTSPESSAPQSNGSSSESQKTKKVENGGDKK
jgi:beta-lactam-binding protein with PASTA domain